MKTTMHFMDLIALNDYSCTTLVVLHELLI